MRRVPLVLVIVVVAVLSAAFAWSGSPAPTAFRLADASAACRLQGERLLCANLRVRSGLALAPRGTPRAVDARVWWDASTPVLHRWTHEGLTCDANSGAILCRNATGATISIGRSQLAVAL
jgi:hypothetical protein